MRDVGLSRRRTLDSWDRNVQPSDSQLRRPGPYEQGKPTASESGKAVTTTTWEDHPPLPEVQVLSSPSIRSLSITIDPFGTASVPIDGATIDLLQYFAHYSSNGPTSFVFTPNIRDCIRGALEDDLIMHCLLSSAASRANYVQGLQIAHFKQKEITCTQEGLRTLQDRLKTADPELSASVLRLIIGILCLGASALYREDYATAKVHIKGAIKLAQLRGGVTKIPEPELLMRALGLDDLLACRELTPCSVECTYDPGPLHRVQETEDEQELDDECSAAALLEKDDAVLPDALRDLVLQILDALPMKRKMAQISDTLCEQALNERQWLILRTLAIRNKLLASKPERKRTDALRISLILFTLLPPGDLRQRRTAREIAPQLKDTLTKTSSSEWLFCEDVRLWCLLIGYFSAIDDDEAETRAWFTGEIRRTMELGRTCWNGSSEMSVLDDLVTFQRRFLFHESVQRPLTGSLARFLYHSSISLRCGLLKGGRQEEELGTV